MKVDEDYIRTILDNLPLGIAIHTLTPEASFEYFNEYYLKFFRTTAEDLSSPNGFWDNVFEDPIFREEFKKRVLEDYFSGDPERMHWEDIPITRSGEETRYISAKSITIPGRNLVISTVWDVTKRKNTEEQLKNSQIRLSDAMDLAHLVNWEYDVASDTFDFDDKFYALYGTSTEAECGRMTSEQYAEEFVYPDEQHIVAEEARKAMETGDSDYVAQAEHRIIRRDGEIRHIVVRMRVIKDEAGRTIKIFGANQDITERKIAEEELKKSEEKYRGLVENVSDAIFTFDLEGKITYINPVVEKLYGYTQSEVINRKFSDFLYPDDIPRAIEEFQRRKKGEYGENMYRVIPKDGSIRYVRTIQTPNIQDGRITGFNYIMADLTDRKKAEEALAIINNKLNMLSSITRHDILNMIMAVRGYIEISEDFVNDTTLYSFIEKEKEAINAIQHQIEFTRYYQDIGMESAGWINVAGIAKSAFKTLNTKSIKLENSLKGLEIYCDPLIEKVFYNLMENSVRHGMHVDLISLSCVFSGDSLVILYRDNGTGISDSDRGKIFQKGFGKNSGLGLFLSREILSITNISITENGKEGEGVNFEITVPKGNFRFVTDKI